MTRDPSRPLKCGHPNFFHEYHEQVCESFLSLRENSQMNVKIWLSSAPIDGILPFNVHKIDHFGKCGHRVNA